jgi:3-hydroxyisobutyrate dehydrogenase-like beta-hydroxyacid dehydrogenase
MERSFQSMENEAMATVVRDQAIGLIGVGNMGGALARSIIGAGFDLRAHDHKAAPMAELVALGGSSASSVAEIAETCDVICVVVVSDAQVSEVGGEITTHAKPGSVVLVHSTVRPSTVVDLAERAAQRDIQVLDVSVCGGNEKAERGLLTLLVGGDEATARRVWPLLESFGSTILYMGPTGSGVVAKLVNNLVLIGSYALQMEGMRLATAYGLDEDAMATAIIASPGDSRTMRAWGRHDRRRAARAAQGVDWSERMGRDLFEAAIAGGHRGETLSVTSVIADALPSLLRRRDRDLGARPRPPIPVCAVCGHELAPPYRDTGTHPECRG